MARDIVGIILAGGQSSRFGSPKAFVKKDNIPFYQYSWQAIKPFVSSTLIITNPLLEALFAKDNVPIKMVNDHNLYQGQGPLAGIYTAMDVLIAEWYMIVPVDVHFRSEEHTSDLLSPTRRLSDLSIFMAGNKAVCFINANHYKAPIVSFIC